MGGRFGEMSTFMNYTFQSFNFRNKQGARPFYDLVANFAVEEFGHIELVAATINTMLTGASPTTNGGSIEGALSGVKDARNTQQFIAGGHAALPQDPNGRPWTGDKLLVRRPDRGPDAQLLPRDGREAEQAARLRDGRPPGGLGADGLSPRSRRRAPGGLRTGDRKPDRGRPDEDVPDAPHRDGEDPRVQAPIERGDHKRLYRFSPDDYKELTAVFNGQHPEISDELEVVPTAGRTAERPTAAAQGTRARPPP
jgi:Mn-containing catalase